MKNFFSSLALFFSNYFGALPIFQEGSGKIIINIAWLLSDRVFRLGIGLFLGAWIARYLGPAQFGTLNYAQAFVSLFLALSNLGLEGVVIRDILAKPSLNNETLGSAFYLRTFGGIVLLLITIISIAELRPGDSNIFCLIAIIGSSMIFKATEVVKFWFDSKVQSKYSVWVENFSFFITAIFRIFLIISGASLTFFAWAIFLEACLTGLAYLLAFSKVVGPISAWKCTKSRSIELLSDSWPLIFSGLAIMVAMRIDQVVLGFLATDETVGIYSAAVRISEVWYFIPMAIVTSFFPGIVEAKKRTQKEFYLRSQRLFDFLSLLSILVALPMTFFSSSLVIFVFGSPFSQAGPILSIHIWAGLFVFMGYASSRCFLIENLQILVFFRNVVGAIVNVLLNIILIPKCGAIGAAWAVILSQAFSSFILNFVHPKTRVVFYMQLRSIFLLRYLNFLGKTK